MFGSWVRANPDNFFKFHILLAIIILNTNGWRGNTIQIFDNMVLFLCHNTCVGPTYGLMNSASACFVSFTKRVIWAWETVSHQNRWVILQSDRFLCVALYLWQRWRVSNWGQTKFFDETFPKVLLIYGENVTQVCEKIKRKRTGFRSVWIIGPMGDRRCLCGSKITQCWQKSRKIVDSSMLMGDNFMIV